MEIPTSENLINEFITEFAMTKISYKKTSIPVLAVMAAVLIFGSMSSAHAEAASANAPPGSKITSSCTATMVAVPGPGSSGDSADYHCLMVATKTPSGSVPLHSWDPNVYSITNPTGFNLPVSVNMLDLFLVSDYYALWKTTDGSLATGWSQTMSTPQVHTDKSLVAPGFVALWDGTGTTHSTKTGKLVVPAGTTLYLRVNDPLFSAMANKLDKPCGTTADTLLTSGCSVPGIFVDSGYSPALFTISFSSAS